MRTTPEELFRRPSIVLDLSGLRGYQISKVDILGFEFEMGLKPVVQDEARQKGVSLSLKYIPKDVFDKRAVDFDYENRPEVIRVVEDGKEREVRTGNYIFENEWQSYRTRKDRNLELSSGEHAYEKAGRYKMAVKVIDIFGNDTTKVVEVKV